MAAAPPLHPCQQPSARQTPPSLNRPDWIPALLLHVLFSLVTVTLTLHLESDTHQNATQFLVDPYAKWTELLVDNVTETPEQASTQTMTSSARPAGPVRTHKPDVYRTLPEESPSPRESPTPLIIASSVAAVCILVFFVLAYLWHTHQLDSRARKLAIRMAAQAEHSSRYGNCQTEVTRMLARPPAPRLPALSSPESSSHEQNHYKALPHEEDPGQQERSPGRDWAGGRPEPPELVESEDVFEPVQFPLSLERSRPSIRGGRGAHRKWNRPRKVSGVSSDKRHSAVTDKEILTHFASRRHSTFFI